MVKLSFITFSSEFHGNHRLLKSMDMPKNPSPLKPSVAPLEVLFTPMHLSKVAYLPQLQTLAPEALSSYTVLNPLLLSFYYSLFLPLILSKMRETIGCSHSRVVRFAGRRSTCYFGSGREAGSREVKGQPLHFLFPHLLFFFHCSCTGSSKGGTGE